MRKGILLALTLVMVLLCGSVAAESEDQSSWMTFSSGTENQYVQAQEQYSLPLYGGDPVES